MWRFAPNFLGQFFGFIHLKFGYFQNISLWVHCHDIRFRVQRFNPKNICLLAKIWRLDIHVQISDGALDWFDHWNAGWMYRNLSTTPMFFMETPFLELELLSGIWPRRRKIGLRNSCPLYLVDYTTWWIDMSWISVAWSSSSSACLLFLSCLFIEMGTYLNKPSLRSQTESQYVRPRRTHDGCVVRSNLHGLKTRKNARKSGHERTKSMMNARKSDHERTKSLANARKSDHERTKGLVNARKSGHERTKGLMNAQNSDHERTNSLVNARKSGHKRTKGLMNARKSDHERTKSLVNARKSGHERTKGLMNARKSDHERTKSLANARKSGHERMKCLMNARKSDQERTNSLVNARKSGHRHFPPGTVWTYRLSVWDINLGSFCLISLGIRNWRRVGHLSLLFASPTLNYFQFIRFLSSAACEASILSVDFLVCCSDLKSL